MGSEFLYDMILKKVLEIDVVMVVLYFKCT
jgi:hypothetical protein